MNVLILHHVETMWAESLLKIGGVDFETFLWDIKEHIEENDYDKIILTRFEGCELESEHWSIAEYISEVQEYACGWCADMYDSDYHIEGVDYCEGGQHSEVVELQQWQHNLKGHNVNLAGAFDGECIDDMETALNFLSVPFERIEHLIV